MRFALLLLAATSAACAPKRIHERPIMSNDDRIGGMAATIEAAHASSSAQRSVAAARRDSIAIVAAATCGGDVCTALTRGEVAIGMTEAQVMAATRSTPEAWTVRRAGPSTVMVGHTADLPRDVVGNVATVQLRDGRVANYSYREAHGLRTVSAPADATTEGRSRALAEALIREGDELAGAGDLAAALDRYDRASVMRANDPALQYRIASILDKSLRPIEALVAYRRFLHNLEMEKIVVTGDAYAKLADAIARARERVIILERQSR